MRGGKRQGAGRPKGSTKEETVVFYRRVNPDWVNPLDNLLERLKMKDLKTKAEYIVSHPNWDGRIKTAQELIEYSSVEEIQDMYDMIDDCEQFE